jgi:formylglycine-generating enzyme required for sulfatase activity
MKPTPIKPPTDPRSRVFRGGGWLNHVAARVRAAFRITDAPALGHYYLGFRCAQRGVRQVLKVTP